MEQKPREWPTSERRVLFIQPSPTDVKCEAYAPDRSPLSQRRRFRGSPMPGNSVDSGLAGASTSRSLTLQSRATGSIGQVIAKNPETKSRS